MSERTNKLEWSLAREDVNVYKVWLVLVGNC